jgi:hypothetical protein
MTSSSLVRVSVAALTLTGLGPAVVLYAQPPFPASETAPLFEASAELRIAFERLPLAALFGTALAFRPRRRSQGSRNVVVIQTQCRRR